MKTSWRRLEDIFKMSWSRRTYSPYSYVFRRRLQDLDQDQYIRLGHTSSRRLAKTSSRFLEDVFITSFENVLNTSSSRCLQDVIKTSSRRIAKTYSRRLQNVFKTSSRHLQDVFKTSSRHLQDVFKTYYQVKLFLVTQFQDVFEMYSKLTWDVLPGQLSIGGLARSHFWEIYGQCTKFPRVVKVSQVLVFHFTAPFSCCLQRRISNLVEHLQSLQWSFFCENTYRYWAVNYFRKKSSIPDIWLGWK